MNFYDSHSIEPETCFAPDEQCHTCSSFNAGITRQIDTGQTIETHNEWRLMDGILQLFLFIVLGRVYVEVLSWLVEAAKAVLIVWVSVGVLLMVAEISIQASRYADHQIDRVLGPDKLPLFPASP